MKLTFYGATRQVTGSMFMLELEDGYKILIDCGSDMERKRWGSPVSDFLFNPSEINLVVLTHAHLDHTGNVPLLLMQGYRGQILCTAPTMMLTELLLHDSASLNMKKLKATKGRMDKAQGLFLDRQVEETMETFVTIAFNKRFEIRDNVFLTFIPAGHLLGAANVFIEVTEKGEKKTILFSGDIGRKNYPLLQDPQPAPQADYLVCESTYGNRKHLATGKAEELLEEIILSSCVNIPGRLIIPAFSVGRTQSVLYTFHKIFLRNNIPPVKIFTDSPMAELTSRVYEEYVELMNPEAREFYSSQGGLFDFRNLEHIKSFKDSKAINNHTEPCIIVSSSGMITGGRMQHHIKKNIRNPYCTILLVGYSAEGTTGYQLSQGNKSIRLKGKDYPVLARILTTDIFSGHGDLDDLLDFVMHQQSMKKLFLVHGDEDSMKDFKNELETKGLRNIEMPQRGQTFTL